MKNFKQYLKEDDSKEIVYVLNDLTLPNGRHNFTSQWFMRAHHHIYVTNKEMLNEMINSIEKNIKIDHLNKIGWDLVKNLKQADPDKLIWSEISTTFYIYIQIYFNNIQINELRQKTMDAAGITQSLDDVILDDHLLTNDLWVNTVCNYLNEKTEKSNLKFVAVSNSNEIFDLMRSYNSGYNNRGE